MNYQALASQGRYGDTTLVHMTPKEVSGLNALGAAYGRPMTVNPVTGYPEAFSLENLLPMIIGTGLNIASGGALTPLQIGMMTGAGYAVATGDPMKGLTAGVGAAGGAGFGSGLTASGATGLPPVASIPDPSAATIGQSFSQAGTGIQQLGTEAGRSAFLGTPSGPSFLPGGAPATGIGGIGGLAKSTAMSLAPEIADISTAAPPEQESFIRPFSLDIENVSGTPYASSAEQRQLTYNFKEEEPYRAARGGHIRYQEGGGVDGGEMSAPVADVYQNIANVQRMAGLPAIDVAAMAPSLQAQMVAPRPQIQPVAAQPMSFQSQDYGIKMPDPTESQTYQDIQANKRSGFEGNMFYRPREDNGYAEGGLAGLREGRFLNGEGDGMSDEIPASIEGEVDALLSDGEFVIPADVVSHLGNGSSAAGAKVLYDMMDRIRKERTGQEEQAEEVEIEKILPA